MKYLVAFLLLCSQAFPASICIRTTEKHCAPGGGCTVVNGYGTAVVINKTESGCWVAITAKHVVQGVTSDKISVRMFDDWVPVENVYLLNSDDDAAFVTFRHEGDDLKKSFVSEDDVSSGEPIKFSGFSGGSKFEKSGGKVMQAGYATADVRPRQGQSGGGVYDRHGRLIGVVTGYDQGGNLIYCPISRVRQRCVRQWGFFWGVGIGVQSGPVVRPPPVIVAPPPVLPLPPVDAPPPPISVVPVNPNVDGLRPIKSEITDLRAMILNLHFKAGPKGDPGPQGAPGKDADPKELAAIREIIAQLIVEVQQVKDRPGAADGPDLAKLQAEIDALKETKIPVQILRKDGTVFYEEKYKLGHPLKLKLAPKPAD